MDPKFADYKVWMPNYAYVKFSDFWISFSEESIGN